MEAAGEEAEEEDASLDLECLILEEETEEECTTKESP